MARSHEVGEPGLARLLDEEADRGLAARRGGHGAGAGIGHELAQPPDVPFGDPVRAGRSRGPTGSARGPWPARRAPSRPWRGDSRAALSGPISRTLWLTSAAAVQSARRAALMACSTSCRFWRLALMALETVDGAFSISGSKLMGPSVVGRVGLPHRRRHDDARGRPKTADAGRALMVPPPRRCQRRQEGADLS